MAERRVNQFSQDVYALVARIPKGRVMTYGQIAALCGSPRSARIVGQVAHWGPLDLPWQRVVNKRGGLALATPPVAVRPTAVTWSPRVSRWTATTPLTSIGYSGGHQKVEGAHEAAIDCCGWFNR